METVTKVKRKRTQLMLDSDVRKRVRELAHEHDTNMSDVANHLLRAAAFSRGEIDLKSDAS